MCPRTYATMCPHTVLVCVLRWVARQGTVKGLDLVDFNYPQHLAAVPVEKVREALEKAGLKAGAMCMRYVYPKILSTLLAVPVLKYVLY